MILEKLSNAMGVSGDEDAVREIIYDAVKPYVDELKIDTMGQPDRHQSQGQRRNARAVPTRCWRNWKPPKHNPATRRYCWTRIWTKWA